MSRFRIKKYPRGFVVEVEKTKWTIFGNKYYWTHFISVSGISSLAWYHSTYAMAQMNLLNEIKWSTLNNS